MINAETRTIVVQRAGNRCEYCRLAQEGYEGTFNIDHIVARQHGGGDDDVNLALTCPMCNRKKGPNLSAIDPLTRSKVDLFNPRVDPWEEHFGWDHALIVGNTAIGRATVALLDLNQSHRVLLRESLIAEGLL